MVSVGKKALVKGSNIASSEGGIVSKRRTMSLHDPPLRKQLVDLIVLLIIKKMAVNGLRSSPVKRFCWMFIKRCQQHLADYFAAHYIRVRKKESKQNADPHLFSHVSSFVSTIVI